MRVSTRVEYGLIALMDIALHSENGSCVATWEIARRQNISKKYLEQILPQLRTGGFIKAQKGIRGGYTLACSPGYVTLADILNALDISVLEEMEIPDSSGGTLDSIINICVWGKINSSLKMFAEGITLAEFAGQCRSMLSEDWDMYMI